METRKSYVAAALILALVLLALVAVVLPASAAPSAPQALPLSSAIIDVEGSDPIVILGSYNWTDIWAYQNDENTLIIHDQDLAQVYYAEWLCLWPQGSEIFGVELGPDHTRQANAGQPITYDHILTNTGTTTDTFLVEFTSTQHWPTELVGEGYPTGTSVLPLQVGSQLTAHFQVSLAVPSGVVSITETTIVTATSQISPTVYDIATDTTIVGPSRVYLPLLMKRHPPVPSQPYLHEIRIYSLQNGSYIAEWNQAELADEYRLEESRDDTFSNLTYVVTQTETSRIFSAKMSCGTYHYRVQGLNNWGYGPGPFSNVESFSVPEITVVPPCGSRDNLLGKVCGDVDRADYKIACYLETDYGWYNKPSWVNPLTPIGPHDTWECDVTTGSGDELAYQFAAFLIPNGQDAPISRGGPLPYELRKYGGSWRTRDCSTRLITFSGYEWEVKSSGFPVGPASDHFPDNEAVGALMP
jgi:hypothetical protein